MEENEDKFLSLKFNEIEGMLALIMKRLEFLEVFEKIISQERLALRIEELEKRMRNIDVKI